MKKIIPLLVVMIFVLRCEKSKTSCDYNNPLEEIAWLSELKSSFTNCTCRMAIIQATYQRETVFFSTMNDPVCDGYFPIVLRNCQGETVRVFEPPFNRFSEEVTDLKEIYYCKSNN